MNFEYVEVELHLNEVLKFLKDKKDCLVTVELEDDNTIKCYAYPAGAEGVNVITSFTLYCNDYKECSNDEEYKSWIESCFMMELTAIKDDIEYLIKIKI